MPSRRSWRAPTRSKKLKFTLPGPMTIVDTVADRFYGDKVKMAFAFAELLNQEALALQADGVDIIQFDEPAFNVYMKEAADWGVKALERAAQGLTCTTAVHICYGYGIQANVDWKQTLGDEWRQYEQIFPALAKSSIQQVSLECYHSHVPPHLMKLLEGKDVMVGVIDVASDVIETPEQVADTIGTALQFVPKNRLFACTNCGLAPMSREVAERQAAALAQGAALARQRLRRLSSCEDQRRTLPCISCPPPRPPTWACARCARSACSTCCSPRSTASACPAPWRWWRGAARSRCSSTWAARTRPPARR